MGITHSTTITSSVDNSASPVSKNAWTADHVITGVSITARIDFVQTSGNGTYTGSVTLPTSAVLMDILMLINVAWNGSAVFAAGDGADLLGFSSNFSLNAVTAGMGYALSDDLNVNNLFDGPYVNNAQRGFKRDYPSGGTITAKITQTGGTGTAGRTSMVVIYTVPTATTATKA